MKIQIKNMYKKKYLTSNITVGTQSNQTKQNPFLKRQKKMFKYTVKLARFRKLSRKREGREREIDINEENERQRRRREKSFSTKV